MFKWFKNKSNYIEDEKILIAYSLYFGRHIRLCKYSSDNNWTFCFCDKKGNISSGMMVAKSNFKDFKWNPMEGDNNE